MQSHKRKRHFSPIKMALRRIVRATATGEMLYFMQNLAEDFEQFGPGPSREERNHRLNLPQ